MMSLILNLLVGIGVPVNIAGLVILGFVLVRKFTQYETKLQCTVQEHAERIDKIEENIKAHLDNGLTAQLRNAFERLARLEALWETRDRE